MATERTFDRLPYHDPRSRDWPVRTLLGAPERLERRPKRWRIGAVLDQRAEGACVPHGLTGDLLSSPVRVDLERAALPEGWPRDPQAFAFHAYDVVRREDEFPGDKTNGTSVLAGAKLFARLGFYREYRWGFSPEDLRDAVCYVGPAVIGIPWLSGMYEAPGGELAVRGHIVGGHCLDVVGYHPAHPFRAGPREGYELLNSWGPDWGRGGRAWIDAGALWELLRQQGDAMIPVRRSFARRPRRTGSLPR